MGGDPGRRQGVVVVDRHLVDLAREVVGGGTVGHAGERAGSGTPVPLVGTAADHVGAHRHLDAVDVEPHARVADGADDVVPLVVVERRRRLDHLAAVVGHREVHPAVVAHVEDAVPSGVRRPRRRVGHAEDASARRGRGADPRLDREVLGCLDLGRAVDQGVGVVGERGRGVGLVRHGTRGTEGDRAALRATFVRDRRRGRGRVRGVAEAPVDARTVRHHLVGVGADLPRTRDRDVDGVARDLVAVGIGDRHPVGDRAARRQAGVGVADALSVPERRRHGAGVHGRAVALDPVGQVQRVAVPVRRERDAHPAAGGRRDVQREAAGAQSGTAVVRCDAAHGEPHQTLLRRVVDPGELATGDQVAVVGGDAPGGLVLAGVAADLPLGEPVHDRRARLALPVEVGPRVTPDRAGRLVRERHGVAHVGRPGIALREAVHVAAVVRVADRVEVPVHRGAAVGVAVAVLQPADRAGGGVRRERALEVAGVLAVLVARTEDRGAVGRQREDRRGGTAVADHRVGRPGDHGAVLGVDRGQAAGRGGADLGELAADEDPALVRADDHGVHLGVRARRPPGHHGTVAGREGREAGPCRRQAGARVVELAARVDRRAGRGDDVDAVVHRRVELGDQRAGGRVERRDPVAVDAVDLGEVAADVDACPVGRRGDRLRRRVERGVELGDQLPGGHVVGEDVRPGRLVHAGRRAGRSGPGELADRVDGVADDLLVPHHAVDLHRRQGVGADAARVAVRHGRRISPGRWREQQLQHRQGTERGEHGADDAAQGPAACGHRRPGDGVGGSDVHLALPARRGSWRRWLVREHDAPRPDRRPVRRVAHCASLPAGHADPPTCRRGSLSLQGKPPA